MGTDVSRAAAAAAVACVVTSPALADFAQVIDEFDSSPFSLFVDYTNVPVSTIANSDQNGVAGVLGGRREAGLSIGSQGPGVDPTDGASLVVDVSTNAVSADSGVFAAAGLLYRGESGELNFDLLAAALTGFRMEFLRNDQAFSAVIELGSGASGAGTAEILIPASDVPFAVEVAFASLTTPAMADPLDLSDLDRVRITFGALPEAADFALDGVGFVPAPGTAMGLILLGAIGARRKR